MIKLTTTSTFLALVITCQYYSNINPSEWDNSEYTRHIKQSVQVSDTNTFMYISSKYMYVYFEHTPGHSKYKYLSWYLFEPWRKLPIVVCFDWSLFLHSHMAILFDLNESCRTGSTIMVLLKESMTLVTLREFSIGSVVKHLKLPVTDDFAGVVKIPKLFKRDLTAKGDKIWYFHFCGVIWLFSRDTLIFG